MKDKNLVRTQRSIACPLKVMRLDRYVCNACRNYLSQVDKNDSDG